MALETDILDKDLIARSIRYFETFEAREAAFRRQVSDLIPRKTAGPRRFWQDFLRIWRRDQIDPSDQKTAYITSNPRDCLVFGTVWQVLQAAAIRAGDAENPTPESIAAQFGLSAHINQTHRSLSGGETVKLALARAYLAAANGLDLVIASPFSWLAGDNMHLLTKVLRHYRNRDQNVELFSLRGENSTTVAAAVPTSALGPRLRLSFDQVRIPLAASLRAFDDTPVPVARIRDFETELRSPVLITGGNGMGKSLVAKALSGSIGFTGRATAASRRRPHRARLLFQDVVTQMLLRPFDTLRALSGKGHRDCVTAYDRLVENYPSTQSPDQPRAYQDATSDADQTPSLLEMKLMLIAVRLCQQPSALILDEPDWGLSKNATEAMVAAVVQMAHNQETAVVLITHKPWWEGMTADRLAVRKTAGPIYDGEAENSFTIVCHPKGERERELEG